MHARRGLIIVKASAENQGMLFKSWVNIYKNRLQQLEKALVQIHAHSSAYGVACISGKFKKEPVNEHTKLGKISTKEYKPCSISSSEICDSWT